MAERAPSMKRRCEAVVVRYVHDVRTAEFLNIGVVLLSPEGGFCAARFVTSWARVLRAFPNADVPSLVHATSAISRAAVRWFGAPRLADESRSVVAVVRSAVHLDEGSIQVSPPISGLTAN